MARRRAHRRFGHPPERHAALAEATFLDATQEAFNAQGAARVGDCSSALEHLITSSKMLGNAEAHEHGSGKKSGKGTEARKQADYAATIFGRACRKKDRGR